MKSRGVKLDLSTAVVFEAKPGGAWIVVKVMGAEVRRVPLTAELFGLILGGLVWASGESGIVHDRAQLL